MNIEHLQPGMIIYQASIYKNGRDVDSSDGNHYTTREEAEADAKEMVWQYDPEWQKRSPGCITSDVRAWKVTDIEADGVWSGYTVA